MSAERFVEIIKEFSNEPHSLDFFCAVSAASEKLALAIEAAERERCAKIAEHDAGVCGNGGSLGHAPGLIAMAIAAKIRSGK